MSLSVHDGRTHSRARPTLLRHIVRVMTRVLRALLVGGAALGPAPPLPEPPPPQTTEQPNATVSRNDGASDSR
jgi:hypothetical protein